MTSTHVQRIRVWSKQGIVKIWRWMTALIVRLVMPVSWVVFVRAVNVRMLRLLNVRTMETHVLYRRVTRRLAIVCRARRQGALPPLGAVRQFTPGIFDARRRHERCAAGFSSSKILPPEAGRTVTRVLCPEVRAAGHTRLMRPPLTCAATPVVPGAEVCRPRATRTAR